MKALIFREFKSVFCSATGAFFAFAFLLVMGAMLWFFQGSYNFIDGGYADMGRFFTLAPITLSMLVPALTMRLFSEEKRTKTFDVLLTRPVSMFAVYFSKMLATLAFVTITLLPTLIYVYSLYQLANPVGSIDLESVFTSYISLLLVTLVFVSIGLFGSSVTRNQIIALILSVALCLFTYFGFELLFGTTNTSLSSFGLLYHYKQMGRGVIQVSDLVTIVNYLLVFGMLTFFFLDRNWKKVLLIFVSILVIINIAGLIIPDYRFDFTADKRYTLSDYSIELLEQVKEEPELKVEVYLAGDLNYGFQRLRNATDNLLTDFNRYADNKLSVSFISPYILGKSPEHVSQIMASAGMEGIVLNEMDREGKASSKVIYPYASIDNGKDTIIVSLLKNVMGNTAEENLNASIENLEFGFIDAIRLLRQQEPKNVAFIEGHDEISRAYVYDAEELLSKYYSVNRGQIGNEQGILDGFDAVIIAGPLKRYSESEKYVIDQYIMNGGKVLWLVDGAYYSHQELEQKGYSASMKNDVNLDDMLFSYGVRINADLIQDRQCVSTYVMAGNDAVDKAVLIPSFYQPLLIPSPDHPVTKNIRDIKGGFASSIDVVNNSPDIKKAVLLTSSANAHLAHVPEPINFDVERIQNMPGYFDQPFVPVAVSMEGQFSSVFANRMMPDSVMSNGKETTLSSENTKMIVVSSSDIISNGIQGQGADSQLIPMGYDRVSQTQFGNRDFIVNAVNWLTGDDRLMVLRTKQQQMYILNKAAAYESRDRYAILNIAFPLIFMLLVMGGAYFFRERKYKK
ncbi:ABC-2 type transport system permease protein [Dysgonomonas sp. PFB1-18]|uniref:gliding motility-associated ABC transporter substrate-binding protein GldG n=1 Tax=unclassified Dysgonomonas TaxID=2630389 RepID=UPI002475AD0B|nr:MULTISPECIES: gliding motility-associated ABC transporter substrate-binding protein GldG [unclassified Dysgonomonas]MDH6309164.1 ABC-2 type transport system permease protein [Dysgonomonas sp. PF1-14]MDH6338956.1 ABC-2 type transport system permease protein [Dysgonomonas sp. PF1-16]MDH6380413.1 ABC-2 type transport system permease protein [Dysgonomonas sp. PFB1-18]MDH6397784.1 ABC-2 type transport system permease protein [Dysgonomonas sp. PF1-23]